MSETCARAFTDESCRYLRDVYLPRLERALAVLPSDDLWWRPHAEALAFGSILLHLEGNVRQWLLSGLGGEPDRRDRAAEIGAVSGPGGIELLARLATTVRAACDVIRAADEAALAARYAIQGFQPTGLSAIYHVVEHFSWHTGQAVWIAKARAGAAHGLSFYDDGAINKARNT